MNGYVPSKKSALQDANFIRNAIRKHDIGWEEGVIAEGVKWNNSAKVKKKRPKSRKLPWDPIDEVCDKYLNDPLVIEIMEKYKELEK